MPLNHDTFKTLFISEENIKKNSFIDGNVDAKMVKQAIDTSQSLYLQPLISTSLYVDLQNKIVDESLNDDEKFLLDTYLQPCLIWFSVSELYLFNTFRQKNLGLGKQNDSDSNFQTAELSEIQTLSSAARNRAEQFGERLVKYIRDNKEKFPAYKDCEPVCSPDLPGAKSAYVCPINL